MSGLVITGTNSGLDGTTGPVTSVVASLTCDGSMPTIKDTAPVPLSAQGNAGINEGHSPRDLRGSNRLGVGERQQRTRDRDQRVLTRLLGPKAGLQ